MPPDPGRPDGFSVGNSDDAFPPGLSDGWRPALAPAALTNGSPPTPSVERTPAGVRTPEPGVARPAPPAPAPAEALGLALAVPLAFGAVTLIGTAVFGPGLRRVPVLATVSLTDRTDVADAAMCTWACNVFVEPGLTVPAE